MRHQGLEPRFHWLGVSCSTYRPILSISATPKWPIISGQWQDQIHLPPWGIYDSQVQICCNRGSDRHCFCHRAAYSSFARLSSASACAINRTSIPGAPPSKHFKTSSIKRCCFGWKPWFSSWQLAFFYCGLLLANEASAPCSCHTAHSWSFERVPLFFLTILRTHLTGKVMPALFAIYLCKPRLPRFMQVPPVVYRRRLFDCGTKKPNPIAKAYPWYTAILSFSLSTCHGAIHFKRQ